MGNVGDSSRREERFWLPKRTRRGVVGLFVTAVVVLGLLVVRHETTASELRGLSPDAVFLGEDRVLKGVVVDIGKEHVVVAVGDAFATYPRGEVRKIDRAAPDRLLRFLEDKLRQYEASGSADQCRKLAEFCDRKQAELEVSLAPERRRALRRVVHLEPDDVVARRDLGQALLGDAWLEEKDVLAKLREGYEIQDDRLVKSAKAREAGSSVAPEPETRAYRILKGKELSEREREAIEKDRKQRLASARSFLAQKHKEYQGVPWSKRHKIRTRHFEIHCNSTRKVAQAYGLLMELIRAKLSEMFPSRIQRNLRAPVFIYASQDDFMSQDEYGKWGGRGLGGYYIPPSQKVVTFHGTFGFTGTTFSVLCHEGTHYYQGLVLNKFDNIPIWLIEGLAVYFGDGSTFDPKTGRIEIGKIPRDRLATIQEKMARKRHTPIRDLVAMTRFKGFTGSHYADSWALIYYLVNSGDDGKKLLTEYWARGMERQLTRRDFEELADRYFGSVAELQELYEEYIRELPSPPAGEIQGDYFVSEYFQFDLRSPGEPWQYFEDPADKSLLIGLLDPGTTAEIRVYYSNNLEGLKREDYLREYLAFAERRYQGVEHEEVTMSGLDAYKLTYVDDDSEEMAAVELALDELREALRRGLPPIGEDVPESGPGDGPMDIVEYKLVQIDGVVSIKCSIRKGELARAARTFEAVKDSFTLTLTRRW